MNQRQRRIVFDHHTLLFCLPIVLICDDHVRVIYAIVIYASGVCSSYVISVCDDHIQLYDDDVWHHVR